MFHNQPVKYEAHQVWFPLSEDILGWDDDFHSLMLNDVLRMEAYEAAIKEAVRPGMVAVDVGTGTGILALWALKAGAKLVYGIEVNQRRIEQALQRIGNAGFGKQFRIMNAVSYAAVLPEKADIIISEILGNLGDNEDMVRILNDARGRFLKVGGVMLPESAQTFLVPVSTPAMHEQVREKKVKGINAGYDLESLMERLRVCNQFNLYYDGVIPCSAYLARPLSVREFTFTGSDDPEYEVGRRFLITRSGMLTGFKGYFIAQLSQSVCLDISGDDIRGKRTSDCWKHSYLPIFEPFQVQVGDVVTLRYARHYPVEQTSIFRQCYQWRGAVWRHTKQVYAFRQKMC